MSAWKAGLLSDVLIEARSGFACGEDVEDGVFQFRMNNITTEGQLYLAKKRRVPRDSRNIDSFLLEQGDVLFNATNSPELVGKAAYFPGLGEPAVFSNHFLRLRPEADRMDGRFLSRWLNLQFERGRFRAMCRQWVNQATVNRDALLAMRLPLPPLPEQQRIATILENADALRAKRRAALAQLDLLTQSTFAAMFGDPIENPNKFPVRKMIELIDPTRPISYGILMPGPDQVDGVKYVRVTDMRDGGIELSGIRKTTEAISNTYRRSLLKAGDLLMSIRGHVGRFAVVPDELDGANITQDSARLAIVDADPVFVRECLRAPGFQHWMAKHTKGVAVQGINLGDVKLMPIIMPKLDMQRTFAKAANAAAAVRRAHRESLAKLDALFASLQHRAFRGEL